MSIATVEKAIIDSIGKVPLSVIEDSFEKLNTQRMLFYLNKIQKSSIVKRIGYLLESNGYDVYSDLKRFVNNRYIPVDPIVKGKGTRNDKWKLIT